MRIAICGGTGFIGKALQKHWLNEGHHLLIITRRIPSQATAAKQAQIEYITWEQLDHSPFLLKNLDALVNLAGASLSQRWTTKAKKRIIESRLNTVSAVSKLISQMKNKPAVVIQASAIAIYGTSTNETFEETSITRVMDFPSGVVQEWENAADTIQGVRLVKLRVSVVLGHDGGAYPLMKLPFMLGVGGRIGSGQQWMSWIHITDMVRLIDFCIHHQHIDGPVNAATPYPVTNDQFGRTVAAIYNRPYWFPLPSFLLKAAVGELSLILLQGQRVLPSKPIKYGFEFHYPELKAALQDLK
ncbi:TIGR01777 family oxidoreductase [Paenibacillus crassostreae]|uniref:Epimerase n=1 Tax=Paenibacillus crassostreae TaxID=1763538 RepID=A0A167GKE9_9BACL|nr:TIGR01777 family oxidoreductase [Paenibacillus crassostreae]AOZ92192.1 TIGR01777 family protein [Paenibacillus crassostreae]OAB77654.1 epimerase [Paenibacillus crassostreae]